MQIIGKQYKYFVPDIFLTKEEICEFEKSWRKSCSSYEPLKVFPEAHPYCLGRLEELKDEAEQLAKSILEKLKVILKSSVNQWFYEMIVEELNGEKLEKIRKKIRKLQFLLYPPEPTLKTLTPSQIEQAREEIKKACEICGIEYDKKDFSVCPFHTEKHKSFYIAHGFYYCFGCGAKGNAIDLVKKLKGWSFCESVAALI